MRKIFFTVLATVTLVQSALSLDSDELNGAGRRPSSFVPRRHANHHVYGAPIQSAIVGHGRTSNHRHASKKASSAASNPGSH
jgi:hypothetical protein